MPGGWQRPHGGSGTFGGLDRRVRLDGQKNGKRPSRPGERWQTHLSWSPSVLSSFSSACPRSGGPALTGQHCDPPCPAAPLPWASPSSRQQEGPRGWGPGPPPAAACSALESGFGFRGVRADVFLVIFLPGLMPFPVWGPRISSLLHGRL